MYLAFYLCMLMSCPATVLCCTSLLLKAILVVCPGPQDAARHEMPENQTNWMQEGVMDVEKDNIARILKRVVKVADPSVVLGMLESTDLAAMKTDSDATAVSFLLQQMIQNAKGEDVLQKVLAKVWEALLTSGRSQVMIQSKRPAGPGDNMFSWLCAMADREFEARHSPGAMPQFSSHYIGRCFQCLQQGEHLAVVVHTLHALLKEHKEYIVKQNPADQSFLVRAILVAHSFASEVVCSESKQKHLDVTK